MKLIFFYLFDNFFLPFYLATLNSFLNNHPDISSPQYEVHYFDVNESYTKGLTWYLQQMPTVQQHQITLETSPNYFERPWVPERIHQYHKTVQPVKLILIFRNPVTRIISEYVHNRAFGRVESTKSFQGILFNEDGTVNKEYRFLYLGRYSELISNWLRYFPRQQIHIVDGDAFSKNPVPELLKIETFLGVTPYFNSSHFTYNTEKGFYCLKVTGCMGKDKGRKHPYIDRKLLQILHDYYQPFNQRFYKLVNHTFDWDNQI